MSNKMYRVTFICLSLIFSLGLYQLYITLAAPQVPYMDSMLYILQIDQIKEGKISWVDVYGSGEHRGLIYPVVTFIEWALWGLDSRISTRLTGVVVAAIFFYWLIAFLGAQENKNPTTKNLSISTLIICLVSAAIIVSPASFELWTLDLGFAQLLKNFLIVNFLYLLTVKRYWENSLINAFLFGVYGGLLILFATYGWSYPFLIASLFVLIVLAISAPSIRKQAGIIIVVMLLAQVLYICSGHGVFSAGNTTAAGGISVIGLISGVLYGAGTVFIGAETMGKISLPTVVPMMLGGLVLTATLFALLIALIERTREKIFLSGLLIFSLTVLAGVAVARGATVFTNTGASRYFVDYIWLLLSPLAIVATTQASVLAHNISHRVLNTLLLKNLLLSVKFFVLLLFIAAILGHVATWYIELKAAPYRANVFKNMADVYRRGVVNENDAALLQSPFSFAKRSVAVAQSYNLSVLRDDESQCTLKTAGYSSDWYSPEENDTRWLKKHGSLVLNKCTTNLTIKGYVPEYFSSRKLDITYGEQNQSIVLEPGKEFSFAVNILGKNRVAIEFQLDTTTIPANVGINADTRELGMLLTYIGE